MAYKSAKRRSQEELERAGKEGLKKLGILIALIIVGLGFWVNKSTKAMHKAEMLGVVSSSGPASNASGALNKDASGAQTVVPVYSKENADAAKSVVAKKPIAKSSTPAQTIVDNTLSGNAAQESPRQITDPFPAPTDAEALASAMAFNKQNQKLSQIEVDRLAKMDQVHKSIINSGKMNETNQGKIYDAPILDYPQDIYDKVQAQQLTVH